MKLNIESIEINKYLRYNNTISIIKERKNKA